MARTTKLPKAPKPVEVLLKIDSRFGKGWTQWVRVKGTLIVCITLSTTKSVRLAYSRKRGWQWGCRVSSFEGATWDAERRVKTGESTERTYDFHHNDGVTGSMSVKRALLWAGLVAHRDFTAYRKQVGCKSSADYGYVGWVAADLMADQWELDRWFKGGRGRIDFGASYWQKAPESLTFHLVAYHDQCIKEPYGWDRPFGYYGTKSNVDYTVNWADPKAYGSYKDMQRLFIIKSPGHATANRFLLDVLGGPY